MNDGLFQKKKTGVVGSEDILFLFFFFALPLEIPEKNKAPPLEPSHFFGPFFLGHPALQNTIQLEIQDSKFKIEKENYENAFQEKSTRFQDIKVYVTIFLL